MRKKSKKFLLSARDCRLHGYVVGERRKLGLWPAFRPKNGRAPRTCGGGARGRLSVCGERRRVTGYRLRGGRSCELRAASFERRAPTLRSQAPSLPRDSRLVSLLIADWCTDVQYTGRRASGPREVGPRRKSMREQALRSYRVRWARAAGGVQLSPEPCRGGDRLGAIGGRRIPAREGGQIPRPRCARLGMTIRERRQPSWGVMPSSARHLAGPGACANAAKRRTRAREGARFPGLAALGLE